MAHDDADQADHPVPRPGHRSPAGGSPRPDRPAHPTLKANLVMAGVVLLVILLAVLSTYGVL